MAYASRVRGNATAAFLLVFLYITLHDTPLRYTYYDRPADTCQYY